MGKLIAWSWSRLECYEACPKKFFGKFISKEFAHPDEDPPHFVHGMKVHKELEDAIKARSLAGVAPERQFLAPILKALFKCKNVEVEKQVAWNVSLEQVSWFAKNTWVRCIFDVIAVTPDGKTIIVIDWKTGKVKRYSDQLKLFAACALLLYPEAEKVITAYAWADHDTAPLEMRTYLPNAKPVIWQEFEERSELIQIANQTGSWEPKPSSFNCKFCEALPTQCIHKAEYM